MKHVSFRKAAKAVFDRVGAVGLILFFAPLFLVFALLIRRDGGPIFYAQPRVGRGGKIFKCWKFRSMVVGADEILKDLLDKNPDLRAEWDRDFKLKNDPRVTKIGRFLRRTSLDETAQLFNVLRGEMSLVGPRPVTYEEREYYGAFFDDYMSVRPGITGLWQVSGRNDVSYDRRVSMDMWYLENQSLWLDIKIMFATLDVIVRRQGAY